MTMPLVDDQVIEEKLVTLKDVSWEQINKQSLSPDNLHI